MDKKTLYIVLGIIVFIIADAIYLYYVLKKYWKKSRYNPANKKTKDDTPTFYTGLK